MAQSSLEVSAERSSRLIPPGGYTTFDVGATNISDKPVSVQVIRQVNDQPDDLWKISVCSPVICYDETVDTLDPYMLLPEQRGGAQVHVFAGDSGTARIVLSLDPQDGTEPVIVELQAQVGVPPEPSFVFRVDSTESAAFEGDTVEFGLFVLNVSQDTLQMRLRRLETNFPDSSWGTTLCRFANCVEPDVNTYTVSLIPRQGTVFVVRIISGNVFGTTGEVEVEVDPGDGTEPSYHRFALTVNGVSGVAEQKNRSRTFRSQAIPNPTTDNTLISLPIHFAGKNTVVEIVDPTGAEPVQRQELPALQSGDHSAAVMVSGLDALPSGTYYYRVESNKEVITGSFLIVR